MADDDLTSAHPDDDRPVDAVPPQDPLDDDERVVEADDDEVVVPDGPEDGDPGLPPDGDDPMGGAAPSG